MSDFWTVCPANGVLEQIRRTFEIKFFFDSRPVSLNRAGVNMQRRGNLARIFSGADEFKYLHFPIRQDTFVKTILNPERRAIFEATQVAAFSLQ